MNVNSVFPSCPRPSTRMLVVYESEFQELISLDYMLIALLPLCKLVTYIQISLYRFQITTPISSVQTSHRISLVKYIVVHIKINLF